MENNSQYQLLFCAFNTHLEISTVSSATHDSEKKKKRGDWIKGCHACVYVGGGGCCKRVLTDGKTQAPWPAVSSPSTFSLLLLVVVLLKR